MENLAAPRIGPLARDEWDDAARAVFGYWEGPEAAANGSRSNTMMTLANHPALAIPQLDFGKYMLVHSSLTPREKEIIILRVAARYRSAYQWAHHVHSAHVIGMTDAEIAALETGGASALWNATEQAIVDATDQLCDAGRIDDATWATLAAAMDRRKLMDLLYSVGFFTMNAWAFGAMGVQLEPDFAAFSKPADEMT